MPTFDPAFQTPPVRIVNPKGSSALVLVCEHASAHMPEDYNHLGLPPEAREAHIAWDPGALGVAEHLSKRLDATLVAATLSRLLYDCNRPPNAPGAMPERSEVFNIPGNVGLSVQDRAARIEGIYVPFHAAVADVLAHRTTPVLVTIHSFTPTFHDRPRSVEIGLLHDSDTRLADAMLNTAPQHTALKVERNAPYGPQDGVTHTLQRHALSGNHLNLMIEIRNDLISTTTEQNAMGELFAKWITAASRQIDNAGDIRCSA